MVLKKLPLFYLFLFVIEILFLLPWTRTLIEKVLKNDKQFYVFRILTQLITHIIITINILETFAENLLKLIPFTHIDYFFILFIEKLLPKR